MKTTIKLNDSKYYPYALYIGDHFIDSGKTKKELKAIKTTNIMGEREIQNIAKQLGIEPKLLYGQWNGYGRPLEGRIISLADYKKCLVILDKKPVKKERTQEEITEAWCRRLVKLTDVSIEEARQIAQEKEEYKQEQIDMMEDRQADKYSERRQKLINKMYRANPLRRIEGSEHAQAILSASNRHNNTDYEAKLEEGREKAQWGEIDREEVKEYARQNHQ